MANLFGIESEVRCRVHIDDLLKVNRKAQDCLCKVCVKNITSRLRDLYKRGNSQQGQSKMSWIEQSHFWPAIQESYVKRPLPNDESTWDEGLRDIEFYLKRFRP